MHSIMHKACQDELITHRHMKRAICLMAEHDLNTPIHRLCTFHRHYIGRYVCYVQITYCALQYVKHNMCFTITKHYTKTLHHITPQHYITLHQNITSQHYTTTLHQNITSHYTTTLHQNITPQHYTTTLHHNITSHYTKTLHHNIALKHYVTLHHNITPH